MSDKEKQLLHEFASSISKLKININSEFSTSNNDYEIVTFVDEVVIYDIEDNIVISVSKEN